VLWFDRDRSLVDMDMEVWDRVLAINLKSHALTARHAIPAMIESGGGAMVHISSLDALRGDDKPQDAYGASKAAVIRLSKSIAIQFARQGIRSNTILPGPVVSPMQARWEGKDDVLAAIADHVPLGRIGGTQDIADACLFLLSDKASFITGTELLIDGGCAAKP
jgi:3-oxoacyl-[acyl-carrier protein] reductase